MLNRKAICKLLSMVLVLNLLIGMYGGSIARAEDSEIDKSWVIDLSFFNQTPDVNNADYVQGLLQLLTSFNDYSSKVIGEKAFNISPENYYSYSNYLQYQKVSAYINDPKYKVKEILDQYAKDNGEEETINPKYQQVLTFGDKLKDFYEKTLSGEIDDAIKQIIEIVKKENKEINAEALNRAKEKDQSGEAEGSNEEDDYPQDTTVYFKNLNYYNDGILLSLGNYKPAMDKKALISKTIAELNEARKNAQVVTLNVLDNIKFSSSSNAASKKAFTGSESIYAAVSLPNGIKTTLGKKAKTVNIEGKDYVTLYAQCTVDLKENHYTDSKAYVYIKKADYNSNSKNITFEILPEPTKATALNLDAWYNVIYPMLKAGKNNVRIQLSSEYGDDNYIARGEFVINWSKGDVSKAQKKSAAAVSKVQDNLASVRKLPNYFKQKSVVYKDPALSDAKMRGLVKNKFTNLKSIIKLVNLDGEMGTEWLIDKNDLGIPKQKISSHYTWLLYEAKDGWCYYTEIKFICTYKGGGTYGSPYIFIKDGPIKISKKNALAK